VCALSPPNKRRRWAVGLIRKINGSLIGIFQLKDHVRPNGKTFSVRCTESVAVPVSEGDGEGCENASAVVRGV